MTRDEARDAEQWEQVEEAAELLQEERYEAGLLALRDVLRAHPDNAYAYHLLGGALYDLERFEEARDAYRASVRVAPDFLGSRVALSHALRALGDARSALAEANEALRRFPKDGDALHAQALAHAALGQRREARGGLEGFLQTGAEFEAKDEVRQILEMLGLGEEGEPLEVDIPRRKIPPRN